ncbi:hypothetical protein GKE62_17905 [Novosphingobium sp. Gsoil 351]|nr:hypothetical protein GKE62_17905 [Novosphingobium sp. Gsoil 351]
MAGAMVDPFFRHGVVAKGLADKMAGKLPGEPDFGDYGESLKAKANAAANGELKMASELLTVQAFSLDAMFTELSRRATLNFGDYPQAADRYARLAFKAQGNCRAVLEALAKLHQPREQTVRHVHVNEGGQAVIADEFHHHTGGSGENEKFDGQSHTAGSTGASPALPCPDPFGNGVPIASGAGQAAMQDARRD